MKRFFGCLVILSFLLASGCGSDSERGIKDDRQSFMTELRGRLADNNIPFRVDEEGYVRYPKKYESAVKRITVDIDTKLASEVGTRFEDDIATTYFRKLLDNKGINYRTEIREDGKWTFWYPESDQQQKQIEMEVISFTFEQREKKLKEKTVN